MSETQLPVVMIEDPEIETFAIARSTADLAGNLTDGQKADSYACELKASMHRLDGSTKAKPKHGKRREPGNHSPNWKEHPIRQIGWTLTQPEGTTNTASQSAIRAQTAIRFVLGASEGASDAPHHGAEGRGRSAEGGALVQVQRRDLRPHVRLERVSRSPRPAKMRAFDPQPSNHEVCS